MPELIPTAFVRLMSMVAWIGEHPASSVDEVAAHFGRTRRQVRRDVEYLASVGDSLPGSSFELDWGMYEEEGLLSLRSTLGMRAPIRLSHVEASALLIGLVAITDIVDDDLRAGLPHAALVISQLSRSEHEAADGSTTPTPPIVRSRTARRGRTNEQVQRAVHEQRCIEFDYEKSDGSTSHRRVDPWSVEASSSGWLLVGWCFSSKERRTFHVSAMSNVSLLDAHVTHAAHEDTTATTWVLHVDGGAQWIAEEYGGRIIKREHDGSLRIELPVWNAQWGQSLLLDIAPFVRDVTPDQRGKAGERARRALEEWKRGE